MSLSLFSVTAKGPVEGTESQLTSGVWTQGFVYHLVLSPLKFPETALANA